MNERIKELAEQAGFQYIKDERIGWAGNYNSSLSKFAELVVRDVIKEMSQQLYWHKEDHSNNPNYYKAIEKTLRQFGVE